MGRKTFLGKKSKMVLNTMAVLSLALFGSGLTQTVSAAPNLDIIPSPEEPDGPNEEPDEPEKEEPEPEKPNVPGLPGLKPQPGPEPEEPEQRPDSEPEQPQQPDPEPDEPEQQPDSESEPAQPKTDTTEEVKHADSSKTNADKEDSAGEKMVKTGLPLAPLAQMAFGLAGFGVALMVRHRKALDE